MTSGRTTHQWVTVVRQTGGHVGDGARAEDLGGRLAAEAARRGVSVDELSAQLLAAGLPQEDPLETFIGSGDSGIPAWASRDIHELRSELAARRSGRHT